MNGSTSSKRPLLFLALAIAALATGLYVHSSRDRAVTPAAQQAPRPGPLAGSGSMPLRPEGGVLSDGVPMNARDAMAARIEAEEEAERTILAEARQLDAAFQSQPRTGGLAKKQSAAQTILSDAQLAQAMDAPLASTVECRAVQCRVVAQFPPRAHPQDWVTRLNIAGAGHFGSARQIVQTRPDGTIVATVYLQAGTAPLANGR